MFTPSQFFDIADAKSIGVYLGRLVSGGKIQRLARGLYCYPKRHPKLGDLVPSMDEVARVVAGRDRIRLIPSGAYAANLLGLSEQVPAKVVFLTDGKPRKILIGRATIELRKASPRQMALAGKGAAMVLQALKFMGAPHIDEKAVRKLRALLPSDIKQDLLKNIALAPAWMRPILNQIAKGS